MCPVVEQFFTLLQVIYELTQGERQLIEDLSLVKKVLVHLKIAFDLYYLYIRTNSFKFNIFESLIPLVLTPISHKCCTNS